ncbi:MAG: hypothetical protein HQL91_00020 [Magnetococcales bacterium]|nr:hypothetical protein [Magnetococcales bacterium]
MTHFTRFPESFPSAAYRHLADAKILEQRNRIAAADHHYGMAAECYLKAAIVGSGKSVEGAVRKHVNMIWGQVSSYVDPNRYAILNALLQQESPFLTWSVDDRYADTDDLEIDLNKLEDGVVTRWEKRKSVAMEIALAFQQGGWDG